MHIKRNKAHNNKELIKLGFSATVKLLFMKSIFYANVPNWYYIAYLYVGKINMRSTLKSFTLQTAKF